MGIWTHLEEFAGLKVVDYDPKAGFRRGLPGKVAYRVGGSDIVDEGDDTITDLLEHYLGRKGAEETPALVIGAWDYDDMCRRGNHEVVIALVGARDRLPRLRALFLGDITRDEIEISWIHQGDVSPLLSAYPQLEEFRIRGVGKLTFGKLRHDNLRSLAIESGGLPAGIIQEISTARLPELEHLELWLGTANYGGIDSLAPLKALLSGRRFPKLRHLGLRNSAIADRVATAVAKAPVLKTVRVLDLSLGNLSDEGAQALLASAAVRALAKLDIHHHYVSPAVVSEFQGLGIALDANDVQEPSTYGDGDDTETVRYNAHSE